MQILNKNNYIILGFTIFAVTLFATSTVNAAVTPTTTITPTPTSATENAALLQQIDTLKEKVASKVASLHLVEKRGLIGTVTDVNSTLITVNDIQNNTGFIDVDQITNFASPTSSSIGISDITKGSIISALGLYNKDSEHLLARYINVMTLPTYYSGEVASIDRTNGTFMLTTENNKQHNIDVEAFTKTYSYTLNTDLVLSGFSKLQVGEQVTIIGNPSKTDATLTVADRIIRFPEATKDPRITMSVPSTTTSPSPTGQ